MYKAVRAFTRFSRYPETRPYRWRALRVQSAYTAAMAVSFVLLFAPIFLVMVLTWPFAWLHEVLRERRFWLPIDPVTDWHGRELKRLNPIFIKACEAAGHEPDGSPRRVARRPAGMPGEDW